MIIKKILNFKKFIVQMNHSIKRIEKKSAALDKLIGKNSIALESRLKKINEKVDVVTNKNKKLQETVSLLYRERKQKNIENAKLKKYIEEQDLAIINTQLETTQCENLIITTYPKFASRNVGDAMITESFIKLMLDKDENFKYVMVFRDVSLDKLDLKYIKNIYLPGMSVSPNTYPNNYKLFKDASNIDNYKFLPVSCSFQNLGIGDAAYKVDYSEKDIKFLQKIVNNSGPILCRDEEICKLMQSKGIDSKFFGDLVLFDSCHYKLSKLPTEINKIAFSVQHHSKYNAQSASLLFALRELFNNNAIKICVTFHSEENSVTDEFRELTSHIENIEYINLCGEADNLNFYDDIDLHVGYRLHGHISFLRRKKPTVLLAEDVRAYGFFKTEVLNYGIFDASSENSQIESVVSFIMSQVQKSFSGYKQVFSNIDRLHDEVVNKSLK
ncbi:polysaccharide pyruvyl transferase family protein [Vibrio splendidus]|uniref:Polysaccharide pyruvyl transferase family protein n=1 Tax=Vibrio splendidus TaxID=29497 RepID=A0ABD5AAV2_VIBSP|nr:polysaccharide pyruvyl transferase family protein [Vibrio splendidus]MCC4881509.1 polysaccharide pyruvyl transferase family protein [Vibrio splendidus]MDP2490259.1 polysaccharide pyruvyl transferase family protein [Vibrio splendidus]PMO56875.1 hypothetical protein BCT08_09030 [Vibrio splendidus]PTP98281.1 hypothetical protein CWO34_12475 [Vibrio splendidus]